ncbi:MAG: VIT1/CCC1 transporter family protein [candidate division NC10 bacterium]|nr:VIT1/CCC1 transporter family protein [candidate division NC10 bacterium]MBI3085010.1 VIT1/CCC1 transporter family protein [candidate division NC10 bacterium]
MADTRELLRALEKSWYREMEGAVTYRLLAEREKDTRRRDILQKLAAAEMGHAEKWAARIRELGGTIPDASTVKPTLGLTLHAASPEVIFKKLEANEERDIAAYQALESVMDEKSREILRQTAADEQDHARILHVLAGPQSPRSALDLILKKERHVTGAGWVSDAIYGINDGLGAVFGIVSGMAGYTGGSEIVLITGLAGMLASALSMGSSAYLAAKSQREVYQGEIAREKAEIEENPEEERQELELFYQLKGFTEEEARTLVARIQEKPDHFLKTLVQEELGLSETTFPNQWKACLSATTSTAVGGIIPVIPFFFSRGTPAVIWAAALSILAHFGVGLAKSLVTTRPWWISGLEMTMVAVIAGGITYGLGVAFAIH